VLNGASATATLTTSSQNAPGAISFAVTGLPAGVTAAAPSVTGVGTETSTLTFTATAAAVPGTTTVTVTGTDSEAIPVSHAQNISLTVVGNNDFSVGVSPTSGSVNGGGAASGAFTVSVTTLTGTPGAVTLTTSALPAGLTAAFGPSNIVTSPGTSALTFTATTAAPSGNQTITISATNGTYTHTTTVSLNIIQTPAGGQNVNVNGTLDSGFLGLTCPSSLAIPLLRGNTNQLNVPCQVYTNTVWNLNVNDPQTDVYKGHMVTGRPVDNTTAWAMPDSMHVLSGLVFVNGNPSYTNNIDLVGGGTVLTGTNSASAPLVLSQYVAAGTHPGTYGIQVVFSAVSVF
jgi:hypothetical protein